MQDHSARISALIGSRICHDLISPIGAISNGLELIELSGEAVVGSPEMALISESCGNAQARIRFFRIAFGASAPEQRVALREIRGILDSLSGGSRIEVEWAAPGDQSRREVQLCFLALMCCESAMPQGGRVIVDRDDQTWTLRGQSPRLQIDEPLWNVLAGATRTDVTPAQVQFLLLHVLATDDRRRIRTQVDGDQLLLKIGTPEA